MCTIRGLIARFSVVGALVLLAILAPSAFADTITFTLNSPNVGLAGFPAGYVQVTINRTDATHATVTFDYLSATSGGNTYRYLMGDGSAVALNVNGPVTASVAETGGILDGTMFNANFSSFTANTPQNVDGFGTFNFTVTNVDGFFDSALQIVVSLTLTSGSWASATDVLAFNANNTRAAAHVFVESSSCTSGSSLAACATGFAAEEGTTTTSPEPETITMLGGGLLALATTIRLRRRRSAP